jgi:molybdate transport repressor ModE-like protein
VVIELRHLQVLRAVAEQGSLAAAARALGHSQPTIAHHLSTLETHFGVPLVERSVHGARLTDAGRQLLPHADAVLRRMAAAEREMREMAERGASSVRVGTFPSAGALLLPNTIKRLRADGMRVSVTEGELASLLDGLRSYEIDAALVFSQPGDQLDLGEEFVLHSLLFDELMLILPADHRLAEHESVALGELRDEGWIVGTTDWDPCDRLLTWACAREGFEPVHELRTDDPATIQGFVAAGLGVALIPRLGLDHVHDGVVVRELAGPPLARSIGLATARVGASHGISVLLEALRAQAELLVQGWRLPATETTTSSTQSSPGSSG